LAAKYRVNMTTDVVTFGEKEQRLLIEETLIASGFQKFRSHYLATDRTHFHALVSWSIERDWKTVRAKLRESLTRRLNRELHRQDWFSKSPSRKRVRDRRHFDYLVNVYLSKHSGLKWCEGLGIVR